LALLRVPKGVSRCARRFLVVCGKRFWDSDHNASYAFACAYSPLFGRYAPRTSFDLRVWFNFSRRAKARVSKRSLQRFPQTSDALSVCVERCELRLGRVWLSIRRTSSFRRVHHVFGFFVCVRGFLRAYVRSLHKVWVDARKKDLAELRPFSFRFLRVVWFVHAISHTFCLIKTKIIVKRN